MKTAVSLYKNLELYSEYYDKRSKLLKEY